MRLLILRSHYPPRRSPESTHTLLLCEQLAARRIEVDLLTSELLPDFPAPKGFRLRPWMKSWGWRQFPSVLFSVSRLRPGCDREPPWACNLQARKQSIRRWTLPWAENVGNGGTMLDPTREVDWVECILKTAKGGGERDVMMERGLERVRLFSWESTVNRHLDVYRRLF
jgi:hypothetical protein